VNKRENSSDQISCALTAARTTEFRIFSSKKTTTNRWLMSDILRTLSVHGTLSTTYPAGRCHSVNLLNSGYI